MVGFGVEAPGAWYDLEEDERDARCLYGEDRLVVDGARFFVRGCLEMPVIGQSDPFIWTVWMQLKAADFAAWADAYEAPKRSHIGPFDGTLNNALLPYPDTSGLKARLVLRDGLVRPLIELAPTDHPLAVEQREGISMARVAELYTIVMHGRDAVGRA